ISGTRLVIGARVASRFGAAYLFEQDPVNPDQWNQLERLVPPNGIQDDHFGWSVGISQGRTVVGANFNLSAGAASAQETVYVFEGSQRILTGAAATLQFAPADNGDFRVSVRVTDDDGGTGASVLNFSVANVAPQQVNAGADRTVNEGQTVIL